MLDKLSMKLLKVIKSMCVAESYNILECGELINAVSKNMDLDMLNKHIEYLTTTGYIDVKYSDEKQICLCVMPKAKIADEELKVKKQTDKRFLLLATISSIVSLVLGFVGAFLGSYFYWIIG